MNDGVNNKVLGTPHAPSVILAKFVFILKLFQASNIIMQIVIGTYIVT